jgi:hypothetical protein
MIDRMSRTKEMHKETRSIDRIAYGTDINTDRDESLVLEHLTFSCTMEL